MTNTIDPAKTYRTREGREVRIYAVDGGEPYVVHGAVYLNERWVSCCWTSTGARPMCGAPSPADLIEVKPKHVRWVNVYEGSAHTRAEADFHAASDRLACIRIEFEEGEGL